MPTTGAIGPRNRERIGDAWEHGGISPFQYAAGQKGAAARGKEYESYGASPA